MLNKVKTVSYTLPWDDAPGDISFVFENEIPAGIHGLNRRNICLNLLPDLKDMIFQTRRKQCFY